MKKIISFACAAILAAVSYGFADEVTNKTAVSTNEAAVADESNDSVLEVAKQAEAPQAQEVKTNKAVAANVAPTQSARRGYTRQEIRSMNILDRPNRPGHFYGNTVRRRHGR